MIIMKTKNKIKILSKINEQQKEVEIKLVNNVSDNPALQIGFTISKTICTNKESDVFNLHTNKSILNHDMSRRGSTAGYTSSY